MRQSLYGRIPPLHELQVAVKVGVRVKYRADRQVQPRVWEGGGRTGGAGGRVSDQVQAGSHLDVGDEEDCHCH